MVFQNMKMSKTEIMHINSLSSERNLRPSKTYKSPRGTAHIRFMYIFLILPEHNFLQSLIRPFEAKMTSQFLQFCEILEIIQASNGFDPDFFQLILKIDIKIDGVIIVYFFPETDDPCHTSFILTILTIYFVHIHYYIDHLLF